MSSADAAVGEMSSSSSPTLASRSLSFILLGASGRTGRIFVRRALERGHTVTAIARSKFKLPTEVIDSPSLTCVEAELNDQGKFVSAFEHRRPDVIVEADELKGSVLISAQVSMLSSDPKPHTAMSTACRSVIHAVETQKKKKKNNELQGPKPIPWIGVSGWGAGETNAYLKHRWTDRAFLAFAGLIVSVVIKDFELQHSLMKEATESQLLAATFIMPPLLTNGPLTQRYESGPAKDFEHRMSMLNKVSRNDVADLVLRLAEQTGDGKPIPELVAIRNP